MLKCLVNEKLSTPAFLPPFIKHITGIEFDLSAVLLCILCIKRIVSVLSSDWLMHCSSGNVVFITAQHPERPTINLGLHDSTRLTAICQFHTEFKV